MKHQEQKTILLVEDDTVTTMVETHLLKSLGYDVVAAKSGEEAVQVATCNDKIALILMDIELGSGMNGAEAAKQILGKRHLPVVFLTVHTDKEYVERIKGIAGYGCIIKNSGNVVLQSSIEMAFNLFAAQEAMRESEEKYRSRMEEEIIKISTLEKQGMARDLHDGLAQQLAGTAYLCRVLKDQLTSASQKKAVQEIDVVLHHCLQQIHNVAVGLLPVGLEDAGLFAALQHLAKTISKMFPVNCRLEQSGAPATFDLKTSTHLYYLVQEAVMNATRHGSPRNIVISFDYRLEQLTVQDDGSGFDLAPAGKGGMGLQIMRYRANIIGGELAIDSHKGGGTRIRCKFARQVGIPAGRDMIGNVRETNAGD